MLSKLRVLVIDDQEADQIEKFISGFQVLGNSIEIEVIKSNKFESAISLFDSYRIDMIILDLRDDSTEIDGEQELRGEEVFREIKTRLFVPVIFYTAVAHRVESLANTFVKVLRKGEGADKIRIAIQEIYDTKLIQFVSHLNEEQRIYFWENILEKKTSISGNENSELIFLLSRRLSNILERDAVKRFIDGCQATGKCLSFDQINPVEMYIYPSIQDGFLSGDILKLNYSGYDRYYIIITPSCDLQRNKNDFALLVKCNLLRDQQEYIKYYDSFVKNNKDSSKISNGIKEELKKLMANRRKGKEGRYFYLPGTSFLPDLVADFEDVYKLVREDVKLETRVASLDNPFAQKMIADFNRFYSRVGTPDLDLDSILQKLLN